MNNILTTCGTTYYDSFMLKTYLYIPDELANRINAAAKSQKKSKAVVLRSALEKGLAVMQQESNESAKALLCAADVGSKYQVKGSKDSAVNLDAQLWGKEWGGNG
jgi:predicted DNA-binding protein